MNEVQKKIQAILFWKNEPMTISEISKYTSISKDLIKKEALSLQSMIADSGIVLIIEGEEMQLATTKENADMIEALEKSERSKDLSKAALETLAIILYKGPIRRSEIDYIRGVNSQFIVRHLEIRGLIEKEQSQTDARVFLYKTTLDLLAHLGVQGREELPEFDILNKKLEEASGEEINNKSELNDERG